LSSGNNGSARYNRKAISAKGVDVAKGEWLFLDADVWLDFQKFQ
jgi:hypothetical protein